MTKPIKIMIIVVVSVGLLAVTLFLWFTKSIGEIDVPSNTNDYVINFEELDEKVYVKAKTWGVAGNHEEIVLSTSPITNEHRAYSKEKCFIFYTSEIYYKKEGTNKLIVYAGASTISEPTKDLSTSIKIIQKELKNNNEIQDYKLNYKKYGLSKFSVLIDK